MTNPPAGTPTIASGGSTGTEALSQTERQIRTAHAILDSCGLQMSPRRVNRVVRQFQARVERNGWTFFEFFTNAVRLTASQRRAALADPNLARYIAYADPTGETAVNNVLRKARR